MAHKASRRPLSRVRLYICSGQSMEVLKIVCADVPPAQVALFRLSGAHFFAAGKDWQIQTLGRRRVLLQCMPVVKRRRPAYKQFLFYARLHSRVRQHSE